MTILPAPTAELSVSLIHRSDGDFAELVRRRLQPRPGPDGASQEEWPITARRYDVLLPTFAPDDLGYPQTLMASFQAATVAEQKALGLHLKFVCPDDLSLPRHQAWEKARAFLLSKLVLDRRLPVIMIEHNPPERGFSDAAPPHIHAYVLARERGIGGWGRTTDLMFANHWRSLLVEWAAQPGE